ncbi:MAG TPA: SRPBCC family protein [Methylomirabilota bacterium]|nr:SRPBCC family protein [Methylomirabilota bacterium]
MASIRKELLVDASAEHVWDAVRDVGAVHERLGPGFLLDARMEGDARVVTFSNGMVVREPIVDIDDAARRFVYSAVGGMSTHYNASMQVFPDGDGRCRLVWIIDLLPHALAPTVAALAEQATHVMKKTLEA